MQYFEAKESKVNSNTTVEATLKIPPIMLINQNGKMAVRDWRKAIM